MTISNLRLSMAVAAVTLPLGFAASAFAQTPGAQDTAPSAAVEQPAVEPVAPAQPEAAPAAPAVPAAEAPAAPAPRAEISAKDLKIGTPVTGTDGQQIGVINRVIASASGTVTSLDIAIGTKPGLDAKVFSITADKVAVTGGNVSVSMSSEEALKSAASPRG